jgi:hypothetical protein
MSGTIVESACCETGGEILQQESRPAVLVRLKNAIAASRLIALAQRRERGADFGGMVPVVIHDQSRR